MSYSLICVNPCFRQHGGQRPTPQSDIGGPVLLPDSTTLVHRLVSLSDEGKREGGGGEKGGAGVERWSSFESLNGKLMQC